MNESSPISRKEGIVKEGEVNHHSLDKQLYILPYLTFSSSLDRFVLFPPFS